MRILSTDHIVTSKVQVDSRFYTREYDSGTGIITWYYPGRVKCSPQIATALEQAYLKAEKEHDSESETSSL